MIIAKQPPNPYRSTIDEPIFGRRVSKDCPVCGVRIESLIAEDCPEEFARLFDIVACDDCANIYERLNKARQELWTAQGEFSRGATDITRLGAFIKGTRDAHKRQKLEGRLAAAREDQKINTENLRTARAAVDRIQQAVTTVGGK